MNPVANSSFSKQNPYLQLAWDATSLDALKQCPRKYQLSIIFGQISTAQNVHLEFGILYHEGLEYFEKLRAQGIEFDDAQRAMVKLILAKTWINDRPWQTNDPFKNRLTLLRSLVWHTEHYKNDQLQTIKLSNKPAIELSFHYQIPYKSSQGENYILCGHLDRIVSMNGMILGQDYKTTKFNVYDDYYFKFFSPDNQMSMYSLAGQVVFKQPMAGMLLDAAQIQVGATKFRRSPVLRTESQIKEWYYELTNHWLPLAEVFAIKKEWPMNDTACGRYGGCQFREICSKSPEVREEWLKVIFKQRSWDPLKVRGDI